MQWSNEIRHPKKTTMVCKPGIETLSNSVEMGELTAHIFV